MQSDLQNHYKGYIANRLEFLLPSIISQHQFAFVPGRLIINNILAAFEILHIMHTNIYGRKGYMALKLDISKTYNLVE